MLKEERKANSWITKNLTLFYFLVFISLLTCVVLHIIFISPIFYEEGFVEVSSFVFAAIASCCAFLNYKQEKNKNYRFVWFLLMLGLFYFSISELDIELRHLTREVLIVSGALFTIIVLKILWIEQETTFFRKNRFLAFFLGMCMLGIAGTIDALIHYELMAEKYVGIEEPFEMFAGLFFSYTLHHRYLNYDEISSS